MTTSSFSVVDQLLGTLKTELENASADAFERLGADLFCRLIGDVGVSVSKPGSQFGGDAGTAGMRRRRLRLECKRYKESTPLAPRSLAGEVLEAVLKDPQLEAWVLASTKTVSETERNIARDGGAKLGVPVVVIDWTDPPAGMGICSMAALCAEWPEIVEKRISKAAGDAAKALRAHAGAAAENLAKDLAAWNIGFNNLRDRSHTHLHKVWTDRAQSLATLNQDAAGGRTGIHLIERKSVLQALESWWVAPGDILSPAVVVGLEGTGKTWVSLDWLNRMSAILPIVVPVPASSFQNHQDLSESGVLSLLSENLRWLTSSHHDAEYWRTRVDRILERPIAEGAAVLLLVDGINQHPKVGWEALAQALQADALAGKVRILFTARRHFFETEIRKLASLNCAATQVPVGSYSPDELDQLLILNGMEKADIPPSLLHLASTPRLFPLIVRLKDSDALRADATVLRLLFEYGKDVHQVRTNSALTNEAWVSWLGSRAAEYRDRLVNTGSGAIVSTINELTGSLADPTASPEDVARRLSDVIDGDFFQVHSSLTGTKKFTLKEQPTVLGLGIALLDSLGNSDCNLKDAQAHALQWLEPIGAIDLSADVLRAALAILSAMGHSDGTAPTDALLLLWLNSQNPSANVELDALAFGESFPRSMLTVIEHSISGSRSATLHFAVQSIRRLPLARRDDWDHIRERILNWVSWIKLPNQAHINDQNHYAGRQHQQLLTRIGTVTPGSMVVHGEPLLLAYSHPGDPAAAVPGILEGHDLSLFLPVIRRAAVREAVNVDYDSRCWEGLRWVLLLASQNQIDTRNEIAKMADSILESTPESGIHPRLRNRIAAHLLRLTSSQEHEERAFRLDETFGTTWDYDNDYASDPGNSHFELELRHLDQVLNSATLSSGSRMRKLEGFLALPKLAVPDDLIETIKLALVEQTFDRVDEIGHVTVEDHNLERLEVLAARLAPAEFAQMSRRRLEALAARNGEAKYWSALAAPELLLVAQEAHASAFAALRNADGNLQRDKLSNTWCLQFELLHQPLNEQLRLLLSATNFHFLTDLIAVIKPASSDELHEFVSTNGEDRVKACHIAMQIMAHQVPEISESFSKELQPFLEREEKELRSIAFASLSLCSPELTGRTLLSRNWSHDSEDQLIAHYGSTAIISASKHFDISDVLALIAPWRWLDAAVARGSEPRELDLVTRRMIAILGVSADTIPSPEGVLSVRVPKPAEIAQVFVAEPSQNSGDARDFLKHTSRDPDQVKERMEKLAEDAAALIEKVRSSGHSLYLHTFSSEAVEAAYKVTPSVWDELLSGAETRSKEFVTRVHTAGGLYLALCEALLKHAPEKGLQLWRALLNTMSINYNGVAKISELVHIALRAPDSNSVSILRTDLTNLVRCNTDQDLFELVICCRLYGREMWLDELINSDRSSGQLWRHKRAAVLSAFYGSPDTDSLQWPQGQSIGSLPFLERAMSKWTNRGALSKYWWDRFLNAPDAEVAFAAWHVFLSVADRRAWIWRLSRPKPQTDIDRLREIHLQSNKDIYARALTKAEEATARFADRLFGREAPRSWLMLDGSVAR